MNIVELKDIIYDLTSDFFQGATVIWAEQINTKPTLPYVTLKVGSVNRNAFAVDFSDSDRCYNCSTTLEVNLYTKGLPATTEKKVTGNFINTAVPDLMDFANYIESEYVTDIIVGKKFAISLMPPIRDLTSLENDTRYRYRSMAEFALTFVIEANGAYGIASMSTIPNSSRGGTVQMAETEIERIDDVEIT